MDHGKNSSPDSTDGSAGNKRGRGRPREVVRRSPGEGLPLDRGPQDYPSTTRAILQAAYQLVLRDGARSMTLVAVAREAHVDVTTVSYHFGTRVGLIEGLMDVLYRAPVAEYVADLASDGTVPERLASYFECVRLMCADRDASHVYFEICTLALRDSALRDRLRRFNEWVVQAFLSCIDADPTPEQRLASKLTWAVVDGIDLHRAISGDDYPAEELLRLAERVIVPIWLDTGAPGAPASHQ